MRWLVLAVLVPSVALSGCAVGPCVQQEASWTLPGSFAAVRDGPRPPGATGQAYPDWVFVSAHDGAWSLAVNATDGLLFSVEARRPAQFQDVWADVAPAVGLAGVEAPKSECGAWKGFPA